MIEVRWDGTSMHMSVKVLADKAKTMETDAALRIPLMFEDQWRSGAHLNVIHTFTRQGL
jgi:hypothetical protein